MYRSNHDIRKFLTGNKDIARIEIVAVKGSTPRESGTWMLVSEAEIFRTIGGGELENMAIDKARSTIKQASAETLEIKIPLGPEIGQCCGGAVELKIEVLDQAGIDACVRLVDREMTALPHVYVFGAGHVGNALCHALSLLPVHPILVDTRSKELENAPSNITTRNVAMPEAEVRSAPAGSAFIILTHDHALDFLIAREALARADAFYVGMIGSKTKRATFNKWLTRENAKAADIRKLICPIGTASIDDKRPEVIAVFAAAEIIEHLHSRKAAKVNLPSQENFNL
ncbi:MAG: xanthine dehydrogenase accessory protein XdhC [Pseudomonadota bacterium]